MSVIQSISYAQRQRLQFIESVVYWEGLVGRQRVCEAFGVSENHVTRDFAFYRKAFPTNLNYDVSVRAYRPSKGFKPHIASGSSSEYLSLLRSCAETPTLAVVPTIASEVKAYSLPAPTAPLEKRVLREMTRALHQQHGLKIRYQSLTSPDVTTRDVWPHALVFAGFRWHMRAYDSRRGTFVDMVLHRVLSASPIAAESPVNFKSDSAWHSVMNVDVVPTGKLTAEQHSIVAKEYGMKKIDGRWVWRVTLKRCLIPYFLRWLRLDLAEEESYPIALADRRRLQDYLSKR